jgi:predicted anti-sigma-YlaC factor YlaD
MNCKEAHENLLDAAQGEGAAVLEEHLRSCASCAAELKSLRQTMALMDAWEAPEPSPYFDTRLHARLREVKAEPRSWTQWLRKPAVAFALLVLMVIGITLFQGAPTHNGANPPVQTALGTAVNDLQQLEQDGDMYANFDILDEVTPPEQQTATP